MKFLAIVIFVLISVACSNTQTVKNNVPITNEDKALFKSSIKQSCNNRYPNSESRCECEASIIANVTPDPLIARMTTDKNAKAEILKLMVENRDKINDCAKKIHQEQPLPTVSLNCLESSNHSRIGFQIMVKGVDFTNKAEKERLVQRLENFVRTDPCIPPISRESRELTINGIGIVKPTSEVIVDTVNLRGYGNIVRAYTDSPFLVGDLNHWLPTSKQRLQQAFPNYQTDIVLD